MLYDSSFRLRMESLEQKLFDIFRFNYAILLKVNFNHVDDWRVYKNWIHFFGSCVTVQRMKDWIRRNKFIMPILIVGAFPAFLEDEKESGLAVMAIIFCLLFLVRLFADYWFFIRKQDWIRGLAVLCCKAMLSKTVNWSLRIAISDF